MLSFMEDDDCHIWAKCRDKNGYGITWFEGKKAYAHRAYWVRANGPIPGGMFVLHKCDNPACVNPKHLFLGTQTDNMRDKINKRRYHLNWRHAPTAKVSIEQVQAIRSLRGRMTQKKIASMYGVDPSAISRIMTRANWADIP